MKVEKNKYKKLEEKYGKEKVAKAFSTLKERDQKILNLYYLSMREVANATNLTISIVMAKV